MSSYKRITTVHDRPLGVRQWRVTLTCGHTRVLDSYPSDLAFREGCACDTCHAAEQAELHDTLRGMNAERAAKALAALAPYIERTGCARDALTDLLTDLRHAYKPDAFKLSLDRSKRHYQSETHFEEGA